MTQKREVVATARRSRRSRRVWGRCPHEYTTAPAARCVVYSEVRKNKNTNIRNADGKKMMMKKKHVRTGVNGDGHDGGDTGDD